MVKKKEGTCHLCGSYGKLTFEHVPPRSAFNSNKVITVSGDEMLLRQDQPPWVMTGRKLDQIQQGYGGYTLCAQCNNSTGSWYGPPFYDFIEQTVKQLDNRELRADEYLTVQYSNILPLRIMKQIITCFFSINSESFGANHPRLREFVLRKEERGLDPAEFGMYCYIFAGSLARYWGRYGLLDINRGYTFSSEFSHPPFGYILEFDPKYLMVDQYCNIGFFANAYSVDDRVDLDLKIPVRLSESPFPMDHRSRQQLSDVLDSKSK